MTGGTSSGARYADAQRGATPAGKWIAEEASAFDPVVGSLPGSRKGEARTEQQAPSSSGECTSGSQAGRSKATSTPQDNELAAADQRAGSNEANPSSSSGADQPEAQQHDNKKNGSTGPDSGCTATADDGGAPGSGEGSGGTERGSDKDTTTQMQGPHTAAEPSTQDTAPAQDDDSTPKTAQQQKNSVKKTAGRARLPRPEKNESCPRCFSADTKFCYYNNYNINQPRFFCKSCQRYWTSGGTLRNVPPGSGRRKSKSAAKDGSGKAPRVDHLVKQTNFPMPPAGGAMNVLADTSMLAYAGGAGALAGLQGGMGLSGSWAGSGTDLAGLARTLQPAQGVAAAAALESAASANGSSGDSSAAAAAALMAGGGGAAAAALMGGGDAASAAALMAAGAWGVAPVAGIVDAAGWSAAQQQVHQTQATQQLLQMEILQQQVALQQAAAAGYSIFPGAAGLLSVAPGAAGGLSVAPQLTHQLLAQCTAPAVAVPSAGPPHAQQLQQVQPDASSLGMGQLLAAAEAEQQAAAQAQQQQQQQQGQHEQQRTVADGSALGKHPRSEDAAA